MRQLIEIGSVATANGNPLPALAYTVERNAKEPAWFGPWMEAKTLRAKDGVGGYRFSRRPFAEFSCVDHYGRIGPYVTFEPYAAAMNAEDWRGLLAFCEEIGLDVFISPASAWNPTKTILIVVWPKGKPSFRLGAKWDGVLTPEEKKQLKAEARIRERDEWKETGRAEL